MCTLNLYIYYWKNGLKIKDVFLLLFLKKSPTEFSTVFVSPKRRQVGYRGEKRKARGTNIKTGGPAGWCCYTGYFRGLSRQSYVAIKHKMTTLTRLLKKVIVFWHGFPIVSVMDPSSLKRLPLWCLYVYRAVLSITASLLKVSSI